MKRSPARAIAMNIRSILSIHGVFLAMKCYAFAVGVGSIRLVLPVNPPPLAVKAAQLFTDRVTQQCEARVITSGDAPIRIYFEIKPRIGREGFRISVLSNGNVHIVGNDERGLLYGVGKLLRTAYCDDKGFHVGSWQGVSVPEKPVRGIYFATHFHNYYHDAPIENVVTYVEDLSLWGVNTLGVWFDMHHFEGFEDPQAQQMLKRLRAFLRAAKSVGMRPSLVVVANEAYNNSPQELRAVGPGRGGFYNVELCPHKAGAKDLLLKQFSEVFRTFADVGVEYIVIWPYDQGSCGCAQCAPWGSNGFLFIADPLSQLARHYFPKVQIVLSTWYFDNREWIGLSKAFRRKPAWADCILTEPGSHADDFPLHHEIPGNLPLIGFPEISMAGMYPWGGFGANPQPARFQKEWDRVKGRSEGGFTYSEGIYEDLNKVILSQFYWDAKKNALSTVKEYVSFYLSPVVAEETVKLVEILERNHHYRWWPEAPGDYNFPGTDRWWNPAKGAQPQEDPGAEAAFELAKDIDAKLPRHARQSWRWRILYLRALLDKELKRSTGHPTERAEEAFRELIDIYHASQADTPVKPPF